MSRIALFGGTFDPVHRGHLEPAACAVEAFGLDALMFVPAGRPPHKQGESLTPFAHRFAMLALATEAYERFFVSDLELEGHGPSFTVDTVARFTAGHPTLELYFVMGSDSFAQLSTWHRWRELVELAHLVVLHRPTIWGEALAAAAPQELRGRLRRIEAGARVAPAPGERLVYLLEHRPAPVAATELRAWLGHGQEVGDAVPAAVRRYIAKYRLYDHGEGHPNER